MKAGAGKPHYINQRPERLKENFPRQNMKQKQNKTNKKLSSKNNTEFILS